MAWLVSSTARGLHCHAARPGRRGGKIGGKEGNVDGGDADGLSPFSLGDKACVSYCPFPWVAIGCLSACSARGGGCVGGGSPTIKPEDAVPVVFAAAISVGVRVDDGSATVAAVGAFDVLSCSSPPATVTEDHVSKTMSRNELRRGASDVHVMKKMEGNLIGTKHTVLQTRFSKVWLVPSLAFV